MARVKSKDTGPEIALRRSLYKAGLRGWRCSRRSLPGRPDVAFGKARVAVFVDGAFWHGHPDKYWPGRSGPYWDQKIARNMARDKAVDAKLMRIGWTVLRFWDFEVLRDADAAASRVMRVVLARTTTPPDAPEPASDGVT